MSEDLKGLPKKMATQITMMQLEILQLEGYTIEKETWVLYFAATMGAEKEIDAFLSHVVKKYFGGGET